MNKEAQKLHRHTDPIQTEDYAAGPCWEWVGPLNSKGKPVITVGKIKHNPIRVGWEFYIGELHPNQKLAYECDNPMCVNPFHASLVSAGPITPQYILINGRT